MMKAGDKMPDLLGRDADGNEVRLSQYPDKKIALYFYPKDNTSGCTAQACSLRDSYQQLLDAGYQVIGVSVDSAESHRKFAEKHSLPFPLITDTDHHLVELAGVWGEKSMYGRKYMGILRTTFVIDAEGRIEKIFEKVDTKNHYSQILKAYEE